MNIKVKSSSRDTVTTSPSIMHDAKVPDSVASLSDGSDAASKIEPRSLRRTTFSAGVSFANDILSVLVWSGMLAYAALLWYYRGRPFSVVSFPAERLISSARPLSTIFSIVFAATFSRLLRTIAHSILERGGRLGLLDQLVSSTSVSSALAIQISAGRKGALGAHFTGLSLILLWSLSPLGSQAILQISSKANSSSKANQDLQYASTECWDRVPWLKDGIAEQGFPVLAEVPPENLLNGILVGTPESKGFSQDVWGNVKIPNYDRLPSELDDQGWRRVYPQSTDDYSSLVGVPIGRLPRGEVISQLTLSTWYWNLTCRPWDRVGPDILQWSQQETINDFAALHSDTRMGGLHKFDSIGWQQGGLLPRIRFDDGVYGLRQNGTVGYLGNRVVAACGLNVTSKAGVYSCPALPAQKAGFLINDDEDVWYSNCSIQTAWVDTDVRCVGQDCQARRMRLTQNATLPNNWTALDYYRGEGFYGHSTASRVFANAVELLFGIVSDYIIDPANLYVRNMTTVPHYKLNLRNITDEDKTSRLAQLLNAFWLVETQGSLLTGADAAFQYINELDVAHAGNFTKTAHATIATPYDILHCDVLWLTTFTLVSTVAFCSSIFGLVLVILSRAPRLAMNISTLIRNSKYVNDSFHMGSYLDDSDRTRLLYDINVRIGDIAPSADVGHIAIINTDGEHVVGNLHGERLYD